MAIRGHYQHLAYLGGNPPLMLAGQPRKQGPLRLAGCLQLSGSRDAPRDLARCLATRISAVIPVRHAPITAYIWGCPGRDICPVIPSLFFRASPFWPPITDQFRPPRDFPSFIEMACHRDTSTITSTTTTAIATAPAPASLTSSHPPSTTTSTTGTPPPFPGTPPSFPGSAEHRA